MGTISKSINHHQVELIKSVKLKCKIGPSKIGSLVVMRKYQSQSPLTLREMYFENETNGHTFTLGYIIDNLIFFEILEYFQSKKDKFKYINSFKIKNEKICNR